MKRKILWGIPCCSLLFFVMFFILNTESFSASKWWEEWGEPQYGGTLTFRSAFVDVITDPAMDPRPTQFGAYMEQLFCDDMLLDRKVFPFATNFTPIKYKQPWLATGWEQKDPKTIIVHVRKGVHWQNKPPTFGREFTAKDVEYTWHRVMGNGSGFTKPNPFYSPNVGLIESVAALDDYTLEFKLKVASPMAIYQVAGPSLSFGLVAREWQALSEKEQRDWKNVTGTGAYILDSFVGNSSITYKKNPDYWGYDEKYPKNKLPYLDQFKVVAIPDGATAVAGLRTGKVDMIVDPRDHISMDQAEALNKTNPDIKIYYTETSAGQAPFKTGSEHFSDIRVRKAMQYAINTEAIIKTYYHGMGSHAPDLMATNLHGKEWADSYDKWPKKLQDEYRYNPELAKKLLAEAGYPNGFKTNILLSANDDRNLCQILKDQWMQIGVDVTIDIKDPVNAGFMTRGSTYDQMLFQGTAGPGGSLSPPYESILNFYSKYFQRTGGANDPNYDVFVEKFNNARTEAECQKYFKQASRYIAEQHFTVNLGTTKSPQAYQAWVKGWQGENLWNVFQWAYYQRMWIDQNIKK